MKSAKKNNVNGGEEERAGKNMTSIRKTIKKKSK